LREKGIKPRNANREELIKLLLEFHKTGKIPLRDHKISDLRHEASKRGIIFNAKDRKQDLIDKILANDDKEYEEKLEDEHEEISSCSICLEDMSSTEYVTNCNHSYHYDCIEKIRKCVCPICRSPLTNLPKKVKLKISIAESIDIRDREEENRIAAQNYYMNQIVVSGRQYRNETEEQHSLPSQNFQHYTNTYVTMQDLQRSIQRLNNLIIRS